MKSHKHLLISNIPRQAAIAFCDWIHSDEKPLPTPVELVGLLPSPQSLSHLPVTHQTPYIIEMDCTSAYEPDTRFLYPAAKAFAAAWELKK